MKDVKNCLLFALNGGTSIHTSQFWSKPNANQLLAFAVTHTPASVFH